MPTNGSICEEHEDELAVNDAEIANGRQPYRAGCESLDREHGLVDSIDVLKRKHDEQQTLLHEAVRAGVLDSVKMLITHGADPLVVKDDSKATVLELAKEMAERHSNEEDRWKILTLLRIFDNRGTMRRDGEKGGDLTLVQGTNPVDRKSSFLECSPTLQEVLSTLSKLSQELASLSGSVESIREEVKAKQDVLSQHLSQEVSKLKDSLVDHLAREVTSQKEALLKHFDAELEAHTEGLTEHVSQEALTIQDSVSELARHELASQRNDLWEHVEKEIAAQKASMTEMVHREAMSLQESAVDNLATEVMSQVDSLSDQVREEIKSLTNALLKGLADQISSHEKAVSKYVSEEGELQRDLFKDAIEEASTNKEEISEALREAVVDVKTALNSKETVLGRLEVSVASLVEGWRPFKNLANRSFGKNVEGRKVGDDGVPYVITCSERAIREDCIEALMSRTEFWRRNDENVSHLRGLFEKIFSLGEHACCALRFLHFQPAVQIVVDCESPNIGSMKRRLRDVAGRDCEGKYKYAFADFKSKVLYFGAKVDSNWRAERVVCNIVMAMLQMSVYLAFANEGRPYSAGDAGRAELYKRAVEEAKEARTIEDTNFDYFVSTWISNDVSHEREVCMISAIPGMITYHALPNGLLKARRRMRSLTRYYEDHVMPRLTMDTGFSLSVVFQEK